MEEFNIIVSFHATANIKIFAESLEEAIEVVQKNSAECPLQDMCNIDVIDGSFQIKEIETNATNQGK